KGPGEGFQTATEVGEVLQPHLAELQRTGTSAPLRPVPQATNRRRLRRSPAVIAAILIVGGMGGVLYPLLSPIEQSPDPAASIIGSGRSASKSWDIVDFAEVRIQDGCRAEISKGDDFKVTTSSDDNLVPHIQVFKEGNELIIRWEPKANLHPKQPLTAAVVLPALHGLTVRDLSRASLKGVRSDGNFTLLLADV